MELQSEKMCTVAGVVWREGGGDVVERGGWWVASRVGEERGWTTNSLFIIKVIFSTVHAVKHKVIATIQG